MSGTKVVEFRWSSPGSLGGLGVGLLAGVIFVVVLIGRVRDDRYLVTVVGGTLAFQVVHLAEHTAQTSYWLFHEHAPAYLTPWAASARTGLAYWCEIWGGKGAPMARGTELLHLAGNLIFFAGAIAMVTLARRIGDRRARRSSSYCAMLQGGHVVEHVLLTTTLFTAGVARGTSTLFGTITPTSASAVAYRVWWHFTINLVATLLALRAARHLRRAGAFQPRTAAVAPRPEAPQGKPSTAWSSTSATW